METRFYFYQILGTPIRLDDLRCLRSVSSAAERSIDALLFRHEATMPHPDMIATVGQDLAANTNPRTIFLVSVRGSSVIIHKPQKFLRNACIQNFTELDNGFLQSSRFPVLINIGFPIIQ